MTMHAARHGGVVRAGGNADGSSSLSRNCPPNGMGAKLRGQGPRGYAPWRGGCRRILLDSNA
jgi:hypothetical protein